jgi:hypothetical protein
MRKYLRSDATPLSHEDIQDIIKARNSIKRASEVMARKYKISSRRVYRIWRGEDRPPDVSLTSQNNDWDGEIESIYILYAELPSE